MGYQFPQHISAARVAAFVGTAAWLQGTSASAVSLPEEALNNFLKRYEITGRQAPAPPPEEDEAVSEESDDNDPSSADESSLASDAAEQAADQAAGIPTSADVASGQAVIQSSESPRLSPGAQAAIGIWVSVAVLAIGTLIFFFYRRRRKAKELQEIRSLRDMEIASYNQTLSEKGGPPGPGLEPVHFRESHFRESPSRAPSGQWMATPPWQEDPPTWRESRPWRQSGMTAVAPNGLPLNQNAGVGGRPEFDRRTEVTAETESTIFAYR